MGFMELGNYKLPIFAMTEENNQVTARKTMAQNQGKSGDVVQSSSLFRGSRDVYIEHENEIYRLSITKTGRLLLTK
jgi:hemin uptake protein HemP